MSVKQEVDVIKSGYTITEYLIEHTVVKQEVDMVINDHDLQVDINIMEHLISNETC